MSKEKEYWQCGHTRKCKWIGEYEDLDEVKSTKYTGVNVTDSVCPRCGNDEFYTLNEEEYQKIMKRKSKK